MHTPALNDLKRIDKMWQKRILNKIELLAKDPQIFANNIKKPKGKKGPFYRLRVGDYRIIYTIENDELLILFVRIGHRSSVY